MEMGGDWKFVLVKGGGEAKWGEGVQKWRLSYYIEVFLEISHDAAQEKYLDMFAILIYMKTTKILLDIFMLTSMSCR